MNNGFRMCGTIDFNGSLTVSGAESYRRVIHGRAY